MSKKEYSSTELANRDQKQLEDLVQQNKKELFNLRFRKQFGEIENTSRFKIVRRNIARTLTELSRRKNVGRI